MIIITLQFTERLKAGYEKLRGLSNTTGKSLHTLVILGNCFQRVKGRV